MFYYSLGGDGGGDANDDDDDDDYDKKALASQRAFNTNVITVCLFRIYAECSAKSNVDAMPILWGHRESCYLGCPSAGTQLGGVGWGWAGGGGGTCA